MKENSHILISTSISRMDKLFFHNLALTMRSPKITNYLETK